MRRIALMAATSLLLALPLSASAGGRPFVTHMTGAAEIPGPGDPDGSGTAWLWLNQGQGEICYVIEVEDILLPAIGAHIHLINPATGFGGVVVPLANPDASGHSSGCASVDAALIKDIRQHPWKYYVNVHDTDFPAGAVRGDLSK